MATTETNETAVGAVPPPKKGIPRLIAASRYSIAGLKAVFKSEEAFRLEVYAFLVMAPLGLWLGNGAVEKILLIGSVVLLLIVELLNTAIEVVINRVSRDYHPLSGLAKDIGSACVLIMIGLVLFVWSVLLLPGI